MIVPANIAAELALSFDALWSMADYRHHLFTRLRRSAIQRIASTPDGQLLTTAPGRGPFFMRNALAADLRHAHDADIISAYFLPPRQLRRAIVRVVRRGGRARLILAGKSDVALAQIAAHKLYQAFLRAGVEIYEYQPQVLHTKFFRFDNICYVGSANMDKRSLMINYELLVRVRNEDLAAQGLEFFERTLKNCKRIDRATWKKSRTIWNKMREQWAYWILSRSIHGSRRSSSTSCATRASWRGGTDQIQHAISATARSNTDGVLNYTVRDQRYCISHSLRNNPLGNFGTQGDLCRLQLLI